MKRSYKSGSTVKLTGAIYASICGSALVDAVRTPAACAHDRLVESYNG